MPYSNTLTLLDSEGGALTRTVRVRLWMVWTEAGAGDRQSEEGTADVTVKADLSAPAPFSFPGPADFSGSSRDVALSVQDADQVANDAGWLFRSGRFQTTLPTPPLEIVAASTTIDQSGLDTMITESFDKKKDASDGTIHLEGATIAALTATLADGGIDVTATGEAIAAETPVTPSISYTLTGRLTLGPGSNVADDQEALAVDFTNPGLTFSGGTVDAAIEAIVLSALSGVITRELLPELRRMLQREINAGIASSAGRQLVGGDLPPGVVVSVRTIRVRSTGITVRAALGAFGGVLSKLGAGGGGGTTKCPLQTLQTFGYAIVGMDALRDLRDALARTPEGRRLVELYYAVGPDVSALLAARPELAREAAAFANAVAESVTRRPSSA